MKTALKQNQKINGWSLGKLLGKGGQQGEVWKVFHESNRSPPAALKMCLSEDDKARQRFKNESELLINNPHAGLVPVRERGEHEGWPYLVMELAAFSMDTLYLNTDTAATLVSISPTLKLRLFAQACEGISYLHSKNILHRDIKPSNILVMGASGQPLRAVVGDFGIAIPEADQGKLTNTQEFVGTKIYRAPEVEMGKPATPASDVYSLGRTLEFLFCGHEPVELEPKKCVRDGSMTPALCDKIDAVLQRTCAHIAIDRYHDATALKENLPDLQIGLRDEWGNVYTPFGQLSAGDEEITVHGTKWVREDRPLGPRKQAQWQQKVSWNRIMEIIGPSMLWEPKNESTIMTYLAKTIINHNEGPAPSISEASQQQIKYQLEKLGLTTYKWSQTVGAGYAWFWHLTAKGRAVSEQAVRVLSQHK